MVEAGESLDTGELEGKFVKTGKLVGFFVEMDAVEGLLVDATDDGFTYSADGANDAGSLTGAEDGHVLHTVEYSPELQY